MSEIKIKLTADRKQIVLLWQSVFGDSEDEINYFIENCINRECIGCFVNEKLVSMLFLVNCSYCGVDGKYVYAVCTDKDFRGKGYSKALINEAKKRMNGFLWLIPADESLFDYYSKFGFETKLYTNSKLQNKIKFRENNEIISYLYEGSKFAFPKGMLYSTNYFPDGDTGIKVRKGE